MFAYLRENHNSVLGMPLSPADCCAVLCCSVCRSPANHYAVLRCLRTLIYRASTFAYLRENHNSVLGMREYALEAGGAFKAVNETFVEHWAQVRGCAARAIQQQVFCLCCAEVQRTCCYAEYCLARLHFYRCLDRWPPLARTHIMSQLILVSFMDSFSLLAYRMACAHVVSGLCRRSCLTHSPTPFLLAGWRVWRQPDAPGGP
jgi:hypothetical protein